jgi:hypothetical protein
MVAAVIAANVKPLTRIPGDHRGRATSAAGGGAMATAAMGGAMVAAAMGGSRSAGPGNSARSPTKQFRAASSTIAGVIVRSD